MQKTFQDLTGQKFNLLTVIKRYPENKKGYAQWLCKCECGNEIIVRSDLLKRGGVKSCGCLAKQIRSDMCRELGYNRKTHGMSNSRLYKIYSNMKDRCYRKNCKAYKYYGARGITIHKEWLDSFENFYKWSISHGYKGNLTIDRIDNDGNYEPSNCRWVDIATQSLNTRKNVKITYNNKTQTLKEWADELGMTYTQLHHRYERGWELNRMMSKI